MERVVFKASSHAEAEQQDLAWYWALTPGERMQILGVLRARAGADEAPDVRGRRPAAGT